MLYVDITQQNIVMFIGHASQKSYDEVVIKCYVSLYGLQLKTPA